MGHGAWGVGRGAWGVGRGGVTHRDGRRRLQVDDTAQVWPGRMDRGVRREARTVHPEGGGVGHGAWGVGG